MNVLFATSEMYQLVKVGNISRCYYNSFKKLKSRDCDARVVLPY